jgi:hypothetical protein
MVLSAEFNINNSFCVALTVPSSYHSLPYKPSIRGSVNQPGEEIIVIVTNANT